MDFYNKYKNLYDKNIELIADYGDRFFQSLSPVYKVVGLEKLVKGTEKYLGPLDNASRTQVEFVYGSSAISAGHLRLQLALNEQILEAALDDPLFCASIYMPSFCFAALGLIHHCVMSERYSNKNKNISE